MYRCKSHFTVYCFSVTHNISYVLLLAGYCLKLSLHTFWCLCTLFSTLFSCSHYCLRVYTALFGPLEIFLLGKASFCSVTMQVTSFIVAGHLIPLHNKNVKASISTFCHCHNNSLSVSGVEEILLLASTLRPDEVQFCSCCCCCCVAVGAALN